MLSSKDKTQLTVTGVLVFILLIVVVIQVRGCQAKKAKYSPKPKTARSKVGNGFTRRSTTSVATTKEKKEITADDYQDWQGSPFSVQRRSSSGSDDTGLAQLSGIVLDPNNPDESYVILNDYILKEGDQLEDITVLKIEEDNVIIKRKGKKYQLTIW